MKVCFLINKDDNHSVKWVRYFKERGYDAKVLEVKRRNSKLIEILANLFYIKRQVKKENPDILHVLYAGVNGVLGAFSGFHPFFLTTFGSDIFENEKSFFKRMLLRYVLKRADIIICNGRTLKDAVIRLGADPKKIKFVFWATDVKMFRSQQKKSDSNIVLSIRNLEPVYNIETIIKAIPLVLKDFPNIKFLIAGQGSEKEKLEEIVKSLGVSENVEFAGWIKEENVADYLNLAKIYVSTSLSDGDLAQSTQQAMACEIPIITSDIEVNKDRIRNGVNGLLFSAKDHSALAEKIVMLLKDKNLRDKIAKEGRRTIVEELNFFKEMEKANNLYQYEK